MVLRQCLLAVAFLAPATARAQVDESSTLAFQGIERRYLLHRSPATAAPGLRPLIVALHGLTQPVEGLCEWLPLDPVADREGFAVAYPKASSCGTAIVAAFIGQPEQAPGTSCAQRPGPIRFLPR